MASSPFNTIRAWHLQADVWSDDPIPPHRFYIQLEYDLRDGSWAAHDLLYNVEQCEVSAWCYFLHQYFETAGRLVRKGPHINGAERRSLIFYLQVYFTTYRLLPMAYLKFKPSRDHAVMSLPLRRLPMSFSVSSVDSTEIQIIARHDSETVMMVSDQRALSWDQLLERLSTGDIALAAPFLLDSRRRPPAFEIDLGFRRVTLSLDTSFTLNKDEKNESRELRLRNAYYFLGWAQTEMDQAGNSLPDDVLDIQNMINNTHNEFRKVIALGNDDTEIDFNFKVKHKTDYRRAYGSRQTNWEDGPTAPPPYKYIVNPDVARFAEELPSSFEKA